MHKPTDANDHFVSDVQQPQLTEKSLSYPSRLYSQLTARGSVPQAVDRTRLVPIDEGQKLGVPSNTLVSTEVTGAESSVASGVTTVQGGDFDELRRYVGSPRNPSSGLSDAPRRLGSAYMRLETGGSLVPGPLGSPGGRDMTCGWEIMEHGDLTAQGTAGSDLSDSSTDTANASAVVSLSDSPGIVDVQSRKHVKILENMDQGPLPGEQKTGAIPGVAPQSPQLSFSQSAPKDPQVLNTPVTGRARKQGTSSPVVGSSPVAISSPLLPAKSSQHSSPMSRVQSPQLSSPVMVPSSPVTSSSPFPLPSSPFVLITPENAIPELSLTDPSENMLGANDPPNERSAFDCEAFVSPGHKSTPFEVKLGPREVDKTQKVKRHSPPNPKHPTVAAQRKEHEKLSKPFRPPCPIKPKPDNSSHSVSSDFLDEPHNKPKDNTRSFPARTVTKFEFQKATKKPQLVEDENGHKHRTMRAAAQFKSPLVPSGTNPQGGPVVRLTPAIQVLERKLQILKRATKIREENEEDVLRELITKWTGAGREVAWEVWTIVKDNIRDGPDHGYLAISGKRSFQDDWSWEMGDDKRHKKIEEGYPHSVAQNEVGETEIMERVGLMRVPIATEDPDGPHHTLGTMLRQLGIDPQILGWDDKEEAFKEVDDYV